MTDAFTINWDELPQRVKENLDEYSGFHLVMTVHEDEWLARLKSCVTPFNASLVADDSTLVFPSEEVYTLFLLRWA